MSDDLVKRLQDDAEAYRASLSDFEDKNGVHKTELGYQWADKPHRHVSDLCKRIDAAAARITALEAENKRLSEALRDDRHARALASERRVDELNEENKRLREALTPFAKEAARYDPPDGDGIYTAWDSAFKIDDLRRAAAALEKK